MRKLTYYVASTVDGFIAGPGGEFDFFGLPDDLGAFLTTTYPELLPTAYRKVLGLDGTSGRFDTVVMGRGTYEPALSAGITSPYAHLEQYVFSRTLKPGDDVHIVADDPVTFVRELKHRPGGDIWLCGGGDLAGQLLPEVDELLIKLNPFLAGSGIPLAARAFDPRRLTLLEAKTFESGVVLLRYDTASGRESKV
jgi:dihydrofolate reductase